MKAAIVNFEYAKEVMDGLRETVITFNNKAVSHDAGIRLWADKAEITQRKDGMIFFCGNGASASMAEHMSHDWFQNGNVNTYSVSETSHLTAIGNDLSFEEIFSYRIKRIMTNHDILVTISSSGNSPNIISAIDEAKKKGVFVITLSGMNENNISRKRGNLNFYVPLKTYGLVESAHAVLLHEALDHFLDKYEGGRH